MKQGAIHFVKSQALNLLSIAKLKRADLVQDPRRVGYIRRTRAADMSIPLARSSCRSPQRLPLKTPCPLAGLAAFLLATAKAGRVSSGFPILFEAALTTPSLATLTSLSCSTPAFKRGTPRFGPAESGIMRTGLAISLPRRFLPNAARAAAAALRASGDASLSRSSRLHAA